jgi:NAD(P)-dependent dehydrogenase (short-subunit alcohol dehydrogenase family)
MTRTVLITGALAEHYAADFWQVIATSRNPKLSSSLQRLTDAYHGKFTTTQLDVSNHHSIALLSEQLEDRPIHLLINNAGIYQSKYFGFDTIDRDTWLAEIQVNTIAPFMITRALLGNLRAARHSIVAMLSSEMGSIADNRSGGNYAYRSSKAALNSVVKSLHLDLSDKGITVVALHPGWVRTDMGGVDAPIDTDISSRGLKTILDELKPEASGGFFDYRGKVLPW